MSTQKEEQIRIQNGLIRRGDWPELFDALGGRTKPAEVLQTICRLANLGALVTRGVIPMIAKPEGDVKNSGVEISERHAPEKVFTEQVVAAKSTHREQGRLNTHSGAGGDGHLGDGNVRTHGGAGTKVAAPVVAEVKAVEVAVQPKTPASEEPKAGGTHTIDRKRGRGMAAMM